MKELTVAVVAIALGVGVGAGYYAMQTRGEDNRFEVTKTIGSLPVTDIDPSEGTPKVTVENGTTFDFGTMAKSETRRHTFVIRNEGDYPLQIKLLETSCKCTLAELEEDEIPPGGTRDLTLEWTPEDYSDSFGQNAKIQTNDPQQRILELRVMGKVSVPVRPFPAELVVTTIAVEDGFEETIDLLAYETDELDVTDIAWIDSRVSDLFEVTTEKLTAESQPFQDDVTVRSGVRITVKAQPGLPLGPLQEMLRVTTNQPDEVPFEIPVFGRVRGNYEINVGRDVPFDADRNVIDLGRINVESSKSLEFNLFVRGDAAEAVEVTIDAADLEPSPILTAEVLPKKKVGPLTSFPIRLSLTGQGQSISRLGPSPADLGRIVIRTTDPTTPTINLYVKFALTE